MVSTIAPTPVETRLSAMLRARVEGAVAIRGKDWAAERLGISARGVDAILWRTEWPADVTVHVASVLGVLTDDDLDRLEHPGSID